MQRLNFGNDQDLGLNKDEFSLPGRFQTNRITQKVVDECSQNFMREIELGIKKQSTTFRD